MADEDSNDAFTLPLLHNLGVLIEGAEAQVVRPPDREGGGEEGGLRG